MTILYTDGGCRGNEQLEMTKREMFMAVTDVGGKVLYQASQVGGSNNIAELAAVLAALRWCAREAVTDAVEIRTDSRNNLSWAKGRKVGKHVNDRAAVQLLQREIAMVGVPFNLVWVPREENLAGHYLEAAHAV